MKKSLIAAVALATLIASPALAQTMNRRAVQPADVQTWQAPDEAFAQQYRFNRGAYSRGPAYDVYSNGQYIGSDPDQHIRSELLRNNPRTGD